MRPHHGLVKAFRAALLVTLAVMAAACFWDEERKAAGDSETVEVDAIRIVYGGKGFAPQRVEIESGRQVVFVNESDGKLWPASHIHPTHQIYPEFDARGSLEPGGEWAFTFDRPGFWRYHNHLWPDDSGLVVVEGVDERAKPPPLAMDADALSFEAPPALRLDDYLGLLDDDSLLNQYLKLYGPAHTAQLLAHAAASMRVLCHDRAHDVGRFAYEMYGAVAFAITSHQCEAGAYHGATEALFQQRGTANLEADVEVICGDASVFFYRLQCLHGVGHGLMAWASYELYDALDLCDLLETDRDERACYSGVFMENVVGGLSGNMGHVTDYLSDDPHYPCNALEEKYIGPCYLFHSTRMLDLLGDEDDDERAYGSVARECALARPSGIDDCFDSLGRDIAAETLGDPARAVELCRSHIAEEIHRIYCLQGTLQARFWETEREAEALDLCSMLEITEEKSGCYWMLITRALELYGTEGQYMAMCSRMEGPYDAWCRRRMVPPGSNLAPHNR